MYDKNCELYRDLFIEVRTYESFKYLQLGLTKILHLEINSKLSQAIASNCASVSSPSTWTKGFLSLRCFPYLSDIRVNIPNQGMA